MEPSESKSEVPPQWETIIEILLDNTRGLVATRFPKTFEANPIQMSGILVSVLDRLIDKIPEQRQTEIEERIIELFNAARKERFKYINVEKYDG